MIGKPVCRSFVIDKFLVKGCFLRCEIRRFYEILFRLLFGARRAAASVPKNQYKTFKNLLYIILIITTYIYSYLAYLVTLIYLDLFRIYCLFGGKKKVPHPKVGYDTLMVEEVLLT